MIALVREHVEHMRPPRSLWVPFELGRPVGAPNEPAFQRRVIEAALALLVSPGGPVVLEDFDEDAPGPAADRTGWVCPVSFTAARSDEDDDPAAAFLREFDELTPWYQLSLDKRGRTMVGVSELELGEAAKFIASALQQPPAESPVVGQRTDLAFKDAFTDVMAYYMEAGTAQPGRQSSADVQRWFWHETAAGIALKGVRDRFLEGDDKRLKFLGEKLILPKSQGG